MIAASLTIPKSVVLRILKKDFGRRRFFSCCTIMRPPTMLQVFTIFDTKNVTALYHPPYSPDVSPPDYFLFPKLKMKLKGLHFADVAEIQEAVTDELKKLQKEEVSAASQKLYDLEKACICANGAYFQ
jgi:histone-lysine N-methyltransferase SETMAR